MNPIDAKTSMIVNCLVAVAGVVVGFTAPLTTIFGTGTAQTVVAAAGMAVAILGAINGVLHGYSSAGAGPLTPASPIPPPK
jgi:hypothetical protein